MAQYESYKNYTRGAPAVITLPRGAARTVYYSSSRVGDCAYPTSQPMGSPRREVQYRRGLIECTFTTDSGICSGDRLGHGNHVLQEYEGDLHHVMLRSDGM